MYTRRGIARLLAWSALFEAMPVLAASTVLREISLTAPSAEGARLVLDLSATPGKPKVFTLADPDRLVIDLPATSKAAKLKLPAGAGPVRSLRDGQQPNGALRLVLEVNKGLRWESRVQGRQLIVDLGQLPAGALAAAPAAATPAEDAQKPVRARHAPGDAGRDIVVAIDPGHGGKDPGAIGPGGTREKDVVLAISRELARRVNAEAGMKAYLTRDDDRFIPLRERIALARRAGADIFISIHADAINKKDVSGSSVYVLSSGGASSEAARLLAEKENAADLKGGISLGDKDRALASVLMDLSQTSSIASSGEAAGIVLSQLDRVGTVRKTAVQNAGFVVLKSPDIPSMLIETAFISNPGEEKKLRTPAHQQAVAQAIFVGVRDYFRQRPPDGTLFERQRKEQRLVVSSTP